MKQSEGVPDKTADNIQETVKGLLTLIEQATGKRGLVVWCTDYDGESTIGGYEQSQEIEFDRFNAMAIAAISMLTRRNYEEDDPEDSFKK